MHNNLFKIKKCRLTAISPIHIGGVDQKLTPFEYIHYSNKIFFISDEKLSTFLLRKNLIDHYVKAVSSDGHKFRLSKFFKEKGVTLTEKELIEISGGRFTKIIGDSTRLQDFRPFIRDGLGEIFIPGTSIKGVLKTAVLFDVLKKLKEQDENAFNHLIENRISNDISKGAKKKFFFQWGMEKWFEAFELKNKRNSPNTDWFRMLHVSDAYPVEEIQTNIIPISILKKEKTGWRFKVDSPGVNTLIWAECIPSETVFEFQIAWDVKLLESFKNQNTNKTLPENLDELNKILQSWSSNIHKSERDYLSGHILHKWYDNEHPNFRIGFGSGMNSTTILQLLPDELKKQIRNYSGINRGDDEAPKSRRIFVNNSEAIPLGWAMLEIMPFDPSQGMYSKRPKEKTKDKEEKISVVTEQPIEKKKPEQVQWPGATLTYSPGNKTLVATYQSKKAELSIGDDRSMVPKELHKMVFEKRKGVKVNAVVEPLGNAFRIVAVNE